LGPHPGYTLDVNGMKDKLKLLLLHRFSGKILTPARRRIQEKVPNSCFDFTPALIVDYLWHRTERIECEYAKL